MLGFLKVLLQGILYVVLLPFILATLAIYAVYCVFVFIYIAVRSIIVFFMGGTPLGDLPEDVKAKRILMERAEASQQNTTQNIADAIVQSQIQIAQSLYAQQQAQEVTEPVAEVETELTTPDFVTEEDEGENTFEEYDDGLTN